MISTKSLERVISSVVVLRKIIFQLMTTISVAQSPANQSKDSSGSCNDTNVLRQEDCTEGVSTDSRNEKEDGVGASKPSMALFHHRANVPSSSQHANNIVDGMQND
jgi:hypothetical protein